MGNGETRNLACPYSTYPGKGRRDGVWTDNRGVTKASAASGSTKAQEGTARLGVKEGVRIPGMSYASCVVTALPGVVRALGSCPVGLPLWGRGQEGNILGCLPKCGYVGLMGTSGPLRLRERAAGAQRRQSGSLIRLRQNWRLLGRRRQRYEPAHGKTSTTRTATARDGGGRARARETKAGGENGV
uniref:Uncharacterized protein n=1 Tax=Oryza brachyantha TaxID=4533 RepID=J3M5J2_ORYBR